MDSLIFFRQIVVIFVIAIEVFQRTQKEGGSQKQLTVGNFCTDGIASERKGPGKRKIQFQCKTAETFFRGNVSGDQVKLPVAQRGVAEKRKDFYHAFHIFPVVEQQRFFQAYFSGFQIGTVDFRKLTAREGIFPENTAEDLTVFLAALGKIQKFLKRTDPAVEIEPRGIRPGERKTVKVTAVLQVGDIKGRSVKMNQGRRNRKSPGKSFQDFSFFRRFFRRKAEPASRSRSPEKSFPEDRGGNGGDQARSSQYQRRERSQGNPCCSAVPAICHLMYEIL